MTVGAAPASWCSIPSVLEHLCDASLDWVGGSRGAAEMTGEASSEAALVRCALGDMRAARGVE